MCKGEELEPPDSQVEDFSKYGGPEGMPRAELHGSWLARWLSRIMILLIRVYQLAISPLLGPSCRFHPSCSRYAVACLSTQGPLRGSWLAVKRIARCHPWNPGGYDPPPPPRTS